MRTETYPEAPASPCTQKRHIQTYRSETDNQHHTEYIYMTSTTAPAETFPFQFQVPLTDRMNDKLGLPELPDNAYLSCRLTGDFTQEQALAVATGISRFKDKPELAIRNCLYSESIDIASVIDETIPALAQAITHENGRSYRPKLIDQVSLHDLEVLKNAAEARHWETFGKSLTISLQKLAELNIDPHRYIEPE